MLIQNTTVTFNWDLLKTATVYAEDYFDLQIQYPDGTVAYFEGQNAGAGWADSYLAPNATTDGAITHNLLLSQVGVYTLILGTGGSASFTIVDTVLGLVVKQDTQIDNSVNLA